MLDDEAYFFAESIDFARRQPSRQSLKFLRGLVAAIGERHVYHDPLTNVVAQLTSGDAQLELIQLGQLKLNFEDESGGKA